MKHYKHLIRSGDGVQVRIVVGYRDVSRLFSFRLHGGVQNSYRLAIAYRNEVLKEIIRAKGAHIVSKKSHGVIGVFTQVATNGGLYWVSSCRIKGKWHRRYFSILKYGNKAAFQLACAARFKIHQQPLRIVDKKRLPCLPDVPYILSCITKNALKLASAK